MQNLKTILTNKSIVDNRQNNKLSKSIVDYIFSELQIKLQDKSLGKGLVINALELLGESEVMNIAEYANKNGNHPGKLFVSICNKEINKKST